MFVLLQSIYYKYFSENLINVRRNHQQMLLNAMFFFLLADVDMFMDFLVLEEQLRTSGRCFFIAGLKLTLKNRSIIQQIWVSSIKEKFCSYSN